MRIPFIEQNDRVRLASIELANSYRELQQTAAWHDLSDQMDRMVQESMKEIDMTPIDILTPQVIAKGRGIREAIDRIRKHIGYRTSEGPK